ncbi:MAG TPA: DUF87 domain-containing protein [Chloroflexi bacterium]|nr:DUF87 domain-containing protein [Chloroflexota bacterium]
MLDTHGKFYLGNLYDLKAGKVTDQPVLYDPDDLTTHAFVVGMTGSGKTGLCIDLLEEAALQGIPALLIDPKGDITNALLHFPELRPEDFAPWINPDEARRAGKSVAEVAQATADLWRNGLAKWGIGPDRIRALTEAAHFAVYTPGSDAGIPISILASLKAPDIPWEGNRELLLEKIQGTVTALLGLVGMDDVDPVRSREHILLSNIFQRAWQQGKDLTLAELILQTQNPPFEKLGVFDLETFFPAQERAELAMLLNNILAAPTFQTWLTGQPLDIPSLLFAPDGKPRHSVFYLAHLSDQERMFFVTLLFAAVETWMRTQPGSDALRAILYFDEIYGYLPPTANPPSKQPMLRMLKQARAFGLGLVLVTQNPVDVDYKALSNMGTWAIGKLQTDRDKQRLLDGLQGASPGVDRQTYDRLISSLRKRVFLLHNVHESEPVVFHTRWAMNYLPGPLTRAQIPALNRLAGAEAAPVQEAAPAAPQTPAAAQKPAAPPTAASPKTGTTTRPAVPRGVAEYFLPQNLTLSEAIQAAGAHLPPDAQARGVRYRPVLLAQARVRLTQRKYRLNSEIARTALVHEIARSGVVRWEDFLLEHPVDDRRFDRAPLPNAAFLPLEAPLTDAKALKALRRDFADFVYRETEVTIRANEALKVYAGPEVSQADFRRMCTEAAREKMQAELDKIAAKYDRKIERLKERLAREERELAEDEEEYQQRKMEELGTHAENVLSLFMGRRRRMSTSLTKHRLTEKAKADIEESEAAIADYKQQIAELEKEKEAALEDVRRKWADVVEEVEEIPVRPYKKDVLVELFGVAWVPHYVVETPQGEEEIPAFAG